jgi:uncharacterized membrane protein YdjX (TVP38/TMEM64 family)
MRMTKYIYLAIVVVALVFLATIVPIGRWQTALVDFSQLNPNLAILAFSSMVILAMVLMFPVSVQAMAAGFIFGLGKGFMIMCLAGLAGFTVAFLLGRSLARTWIEKWASQRPEFAAIDKAINQRGLVIVVLARLAQVLPYNLLNYSFGLTSVSLRDYVLGSAMGMLPGIFMFVFLGTTATDIAAIMNGELNLGEYELWIGGFGLMALVAIVVLITRVAQKALRDQLEIPQ